MSIDEIKIEKYYTDGKGNVRLVSGEGPQFRRWTHQSDCNCVQYIVTKTGKHAKGKVGTVGRMTRYSFAQWAKSEVQPEPCTCPVTCDTIVD